MQMLKLLFPALVLALGCGGSDKQPVAPAPEPIAPAPADPALPPEPPKPAPAPPLALGAAKINMAASADAKIEVVLAADGTFTGTATEAAPAVKTKAKAKAKKVAPKITKKTGKLGEREAVFDDKPAARLGEDGTVSVSVHQIEKVEGKVVKDESTWQPLGVLDAEGVFTSAKDGAKLSIGDDGKVAGFPAEMAVQVEAAPEMRRTAMFLVLTMMAGGRRVESGMTSDPNNQTVPVQPMQSK